MRCIIFATLAIAGCLASTASAQIGFRTRRGQAANFAAGISLAPSQGSPRTLRIKRAGDQSGTPLGYAPAMVGMPILKHADMFDDQPGLHPKVEVIAHSSGNEQLPHLKGLAPHAPNLLGNWMTLTASVTNETAGEAGSHWDLRRNNTLGLRTSPGSDLVAYYYEPGVSQQLAGTTIVEQLAENISYGGASNSTDIDALDWGIGVITEMQQVSVGGLIFSDANSYYFSVSIESANNINTFYDSKPGEFADPKAGSSPVEAHAATVYKIYWDGSDWTRPKEVWTWSELGLQAHDNIDALGIDKAGEEVLVFSTQPEAGRSQLLAFDKQLFQSHGVRSVELVSEVTVNNQTVVVSVADELGIRPTAATPPGEEPDDLDAVCFIEPEPGYYSKFVGRASYSPLPGEPMGLAVTRSRDPETSDADTPAKKFLFLQVNGWGESGPAAGTVHFFSITSTSSDPELFLSIPRSATQDSIDIVLDPNDLPRSSGFQDPIGVVAAFYNGTKWVSSWWCLFEN